MKSDLGLLHFRQILYWLYCKGFPARNQGLTFLIVQCISRECIWILFHLVTLQMERAKWEICSMLWRSTIPLIRKSISLSSEVEMPHYLLVISNENGSNNNKNNEIVLNWWFFSSSPIPFFTFFTFRNCFPTPQLKSKCLFWNSLRTHLLHTSGFQAVLEIR